jgi:hypothetical protein
MRKADIAAGVVYALEAGAAEPAPVMFLTDGGGPLYVEVMGAPGNVRDLSPAESRWHTKPGRSHVSTYGYAAVTGGDGWRTFEQTQAFAQAMTDLTPSQELERMLAGGYPSAEGTRFTAVNRLGQVKRTWREYRLSRLAADREAETEKKRLDALGRRAEAARRTMGRRGFDMTWSSHHGEFAVSLEDMEALVELLPGPDGRP